MTATTKERRDCWRKVAGAGECSVVQVPPAELRALIGDSDRLAAIEAVTGEEVRELAEVAVAVGSPRIATALISLSTKIAEQAEEIDRLRTALCAIRDTGTVGLIDEIAATALSDNPDDRSDRAAEAIRQAM